MSSGDGDAAPGLPKFLSGGGEMGALMRAHDWAATPLGPPEGWPGALKTAIRLILNTGHPMYIWWGPDLLCFYNDAYRKTLGPERHPRSLGRPGRAVWAEIWPLIGEQVDQVMAGRGSTWDENRLVPSTRFERLDEIYWTYSYSPIDDETAPGGVGGVLVVCAETTQAVLAERRLSSEADRQRQLLDHAPGFIAVLSGPEHVYEFVNESYNRLFDRRGFVGKTLRQAFPELEGQGIYELLDRVYATGERFVATAMPLMLQASPEAERTQRFLDFIYEPVRDADGAVTGIFVDGYDVTERVRAEAGLRDAQERYLALFNAIDQGFCTIEVAFDEAGVASDYRFLEVSPAFERQTGIVDGAGRWMRDIAPDQDQHWFDTYGRVALTGEPARFENYSTPLGRWFEVYAFRISGPNRVALLFRDVTDHKDAESALLELNDTLEQQVRARTAERNRLWEMSSDLFAIMGFDGTLKAINPAWETVLGRDAETLLSLSFREQVHPDDHGAVEQVMTRLLKGETAQRFEDRLRHADGSWRWISWTLVPEGDVFYAVGRDVTEDRARAAALRLHENIIQSDRSPICAFDTEFRLIAFNQAHNDEFRRVNGFDSKLGDVFPDLFIAEQQPVMRALMGRALAGERFTVIEEFGRPELGKPHWEITYTPLRDDGGRIIGAFHHARDITDRLVAEAELQEAQAALRQSQKMEAMGQLTGGVAHDFNNLLTPIVGSLDLLQRKGIGGERERRMIDGAMQSAERAKTLVQRLLAFARRQPLQTQAVDVGALVSGMAELVASTSGPRVRVKIDIADHLPAAVADANQVEMAILNLAVNARDAMPDGGALTISARPSRVEAGDRSGLLPGLYVCLSIADTGVGMNETTLARAVEPFFSTKGIGRGTGLGLSMVHGLAAQLGGGLSIASKPGLGTCVELHLPASTQAATVSEPAASVQAQSPVGTVLLVDDEELVRLSTADMLVDLGYAVVEAGSAEEALRLVDGGQAFDVLVTDHLMPGLSGTELAYALRERRPDVSVLIVSGYADVEGLAPELPRLVKPFRQADIAAKLAELISPPSA